MEKNPQAQALAFKQCRRKLLKIKELNIKPDMSAEDTDALIEMLAEAKVAEGKDLAEAVKGQRWYVESLVAFSKLPVSEQFEHEYTEAFADSASEAELLANLKTLAA